MTTEQIIEILAKHDLDPETTNWKIAAEIHAKQEEKVRELLYKIGEWFNKQPYAFISMQMVDQFLNEQEGI